LLPGALAVLVGCGQASGERTAEATAAIVNGALDTQHPAVVLLVGSHSLCSGTIIEADAEQALGVVLTAAHCVRAETPYLVVQGVDPTDPDVTYRVLESEAHPSYKGDEYDFGVVRFMGADDATPRLDRLRLDEDDTTVGDDVVAVGYGLTLPGPTTALMNERHYVAQTVVDATPTSLETTGFGSACSGDSGGPTLRLVDGVEKVAAVHSKGTGDCVLTSLEARVTAGQDFIDGFLAAPVGESCERCYETLLSNGGACVDAARTCGDDPACSDLGSCLAGCDSTECDERCATEHRGGLDEYVAYGACTCDPCDLCAGNEFCTRIAAFRSLREHLLDAGAVDAAGGPSPVDGGAPAESTGLYARGGGGCQCGVPRPRRRAPWEVALPLAGLLLALLGRRGSPLSAERCVLIRSSRGSRQRAR
jgi:hypothetical protein